MILASGIPQVPISEQCSLSKIQIEIQSVAKKKIKGQRSTHDMAQIAVDDFLVPLVVDGRRARDRELHGHGTVEEPANGVR